MSRIRSVLCVAVLAAGASPRLPAAETGDLDGDGRLTIADVRTYYDLPGAAWTPGSMAGFDAYPCATSNPWYMHHLIPASIYLESLRRGVAGSLPYWENVWEGLPAPAEPLPADPRAAVELASVTVPGGESDEVELRFWLDLEAPVRSFSLLFEADGGVLRPRSSPSVPSFGSIDWSSMSGLLTSFRHEGGDLTVYAPVHAYLITGGKYVVLYNLYENLRADIPEGQYLIITQGRLPRDTAPGDYAVRLLPSSEVLFTDDGTVAQPVAEGTGGITVGRTVTSGWDEGVPPMSIDPEARRVLGPVEFRVTDAEGYPGDVVTVEVELKTETPLNELFYELQWPGGELVCAPGATLLFTNPEDGRLYQPYQGPGCSTNLGGRVGDHAAWFYLAGASEFRGDYPGRLLEYFKPLGEWTAISQLELQIPEDARGGDEIPLVFRKWVQGGLANPPRPAAMYPYGMRWNCDWPWAESPKWTYEFLWHDGVVRVLGENDPPDPEPIDAGIRVFLGEAEGEPRDLVPVPVLASNELQLGRLRLVVETDPRAATVEAVEVDVVNLRTQETVAQVTPRGTVGLFRECLDLGDPVGIRCWYGNPLRVDFYSSEERFAAVDLQRSSEIADYPGPELVEVGRLLVRLHDRSPLDEIPLRHAQATFGFTGVQVEGEPGGSVFTGERWEFVPATETGDGLIRLRLAGAPFRRGDTNSDGQVNLTDAVRLLRHLFAGEREPECKDAADSDDSGTLELTDAVFTLNVLFRGRGVFPAPYPECGKDRSRDDLGCQVTPCGDE